MTLIKFRLMALHTPSLRTSNSKFVCFTSLWRWSL